jgi:hypothetical protein
VKPDSIGHNLWDPGRLPSLRLEPAHGDGAGSAQHHEAVIDLPESVSACSPIIIIIIIIVIRLDCPNTKFVVNFSDIYCNLDGADALSSRIVMF